jgi:hypothetical protein
MGSGGDVSTTEIVDTGGWFLPSDPAAVIRLLLAYSWIKRALVSRSSHADIRLRNKDVCRRKGPWR